MNTCIKYLSCCCVLLSSVALLTAQKDSLELIQVMKPLTKELIESEDLRAKVYPDRYSLIDVPNIVAARNHELAAWYLVNVFEEHQLKVFRIVELISYRSDTPDLFIEAYKTYMYADPNLMSYANGVPELMNPKKLESLTIIANTLNRYYMNYKFKDFKETGL